MAGSPAGAPEAMEHVFAAVDLGASSGRVMAGRLELRHDPGAPADGRLELVETARFPNGPVTLPTEVGPRLHWDVRCWG